MSIRVVYALYQQTPTTGHVMVYTQWCQLFITTTGDYYVLLLNALTDHVRQHV